MHFFCILNEDLQFNDVNRNDNKNWLWPICRQQLDTSKNDEACIVVCLICLILKVTSFNCSAETMGSGKITSHTTSNDVQLKICIVCQRETVFRCRWCCCCYSQSHTIKCIFFPRKSNMSSLNASFRRMRIIIRETEKNGLTHWHWMHTHNHPMTTIIIAIKVDLNLLCN